MLTLDVGCGDRPKGDVNLDLFKDVTEHLQGYRGNVNVSSTYNFVQGTVYSLPFRNESFDVVLCHHTLEHLTCPVDAVKELLRVCAGRVEIVVPYRYHELVQNWFLPFRKRWMRKHHKWNFDKKMLLKAFSSINSVDVKIKYRYKLFPMMHLLPKLHLTLKQFLVQYVIYGFLDMALPPTPSELVATVTKRKVKPMVRAT